MAESGINSYFPSQTVSDAEKLSYDYGIKVGKAIKSYFFKPRSPLTPFCKYQ